MSNNVEYNVDTDTWWFVTDRGGNFGVHPDNIKKFTQDMGTTFCPITINTQDGLTVNIRASMFEILSCAYENNDDVIKRIPVFSRHTYTYSPMTTIHVSGYLSKDGMTIEDFYEK